MTVPRVPRPRLRTVTNQTGLQHFQCGKMGAGRLFHDIVVVKATVTLSDDPVVAEKQAPILLADEPWDPDLTELSSLKRAGDLLLTKPSTDVIVTGTARAPRGQPAPEWDAAIEVVRGSDTVLGVPRPGARAAPVATHTTAKRLGADPPRAHAGGAHPAMSLAYGGAYIRSPDSEASTMGALPKPPARGLP